MKTRIAFMILSFLFEHSDPRAAKTLLFFLRGATTTLTRDQTLPVSGVQRLEDLAEIKHRKRTRRYQSDRRRDLVFFQQSLLHRFTLLRHEVRHRAGRVRRFSALPAYQSSLQARVAL